MRCEDTAYTPGLRIRIQIFFPSGPDPVPKSRIRITAQCARGAVLRHYIQTRDGGSGSAFPAG